MLAHGTGPGRAVATLDGVPLAGYGWRMLAVVVDGVIIGLLSALPLIGLYARMARRVSAYWAEALAAARTGQPTPTLDVATLYTASDQLLIWVVGVGVGLVYNVVFWRFLGATPGKLVVGLRVVPVDRGRPAGRLPWATAIVRALVWVPPTYSYLILLRLLDVLLPLWTPKRQALHDLAARTQVVKIR